MRRIALGIVVLGALGGAASAQAYPATSPFGRDFEERAIGSRTAQLFTLTVDCTEDSANPGICLDDTPLTPNVTVTGQFEIAGNGCTATLPGNTTVGTSCTFEVVFAPRTLGPQNGIVSVGDPGGFGQVGVKGVGVAAPAPPARVTAPIQKKCKKKGKRKKKKRCRKKRR
jgi:hypothetical protein